MSAPLLEVEGLATEFPTRRGVVHAVNDVAFTVAEGESLGVVGESGCGKSATIRSLIGLVRPPGRVVRGTVRFGGVDLLRIPAKQRRRIRGAQIGFVPQSPFGALDPVLSIERQFRKVIRAHTPASARQCRQRARQMLDAVGIADPARVLRGYAHELSGGMAQRVVLALALVLDPRLLLADEPTTGLDITVQRQILDLLMELLGGRRSLILVTHDLGVVAHYCHRVVVMYAGRVVETGSVRDVFRRPAHPYTRALLASVPRPGAPLISLPGKVPDLIAYPAGCPFYERCPERHDPRCQTELPPLVEVTPGHWAASFYAAAADRVPSP